MRVPPNALCVPESRGLLRTNSARHSGKEIKVVPIQIKVGSHWWVRPTDATGQTNVLIMTLWDKLVLLSLSFYGINGASYIVVNELVTVLLAVRMVKITCMSRLIYTCSSIYVCATIFSCGRYTLPMPQELCFVDLFISQISHKLMSSSGVYLPLINMTIIYHYLSLPSKNLSGDLKNLTP